MAFTKDMFERLKEAEQYRKAQAYESCQRMVDKLVKNLDAEQEANYFLESERRNFKDFLKEIADLQLEEIRRAAARMLEEWKE